MKKLVLFLLVTSFFYQSFATSHGSQTINSQADWDALHFTSGDNFTTLTINTTLTITGAFTTSDILTIGAGANVFSVDSNVVSYGLLITDGGKLDIAGNFTTTNGATINNNGYLKVSGTTIISGSNLTIQNKATLIVNNANLETTSIISNGANLLITGKAIAKTIAVNEYSHLEVITGASLSLSEQLQLKDNTSIVLCEKIYVSYVTGLLHSAGTFNDATDIFYCKNASFLPIELVSFNAETVGNTVHLSWTTASESNNNYFLVEKSSDGIKYETIGIVTGSGNSSTLIDYDLIDKNLSKGDNYYRLSQVDFNGDSKAIAYKYINYTETTEFLVETRKNELFFVNSNDSENIELSIYNITGSLLFYDKIPLSTNQKYDLSFLNTGCYFVKILKDNQLITKKVIIE